MGSGDKFRFQWMPRQVWAIGMSFITRGEHEISIQIDLLKASIYIGIGKGYEEFERE